MNKSLLYTLLGLSVTALSSSAIFVRLAAAPSPVTAFYRLFFSLLMLLPLLLFSKRERRDFLALDKKTVATAALSGVILGIHYIIWFESLNWTSVTSSTVIVTLQPIFTMTYAYLFSRKKESMKSVIGCIIAIMGSFIIGYGDFRGGADALKGDVMALIAAAVISLYFFFGEGLRKKMSAVSYSVAAFTGSTVFLFLYALIKGESFFGYSGNTYLSFFGLALVATMMGQFVFNLLLKWISATTVTAAVLAEPIGTGFLAWLIFGDRIGASQWIGIAVIIGGLSLYFTQRKKS